MNINSFEFSYLLVSLQNSQIVERACFRRGNDVPSIQIIENVEPNSSLFTDDDIIGTAGDGENGTNRPKLIKNYLSRTLDRKIWAM